jgi:hypothetical protein
VAKIQANFDFLKNYGIFIDGSAMLQLDATATPKTEKISLEGIPGDVIARNLSLSLAGLSTSVLGEVDLAATSWGAMLATRLAGVDADPATAETQAVDLATAKVQTVIRGQRWKIITKNPTDPKKIGPTFFVRATATAGVYELLAEGQTFVLPAQSFSIEIVGSLKIEHGGSSNPSAPDAVRLFGGFFLRITADRFEIFVQAEAKVPALGLNGKAVGLLIIDANTTRPGLPGWPCWSTSSSTWAGPRAAARPRRWKASSSCAARSR